MKLNLGCGTTKRDGWVNVDKFAECSPDVVCDLEVAPWPFEDNSAEEVELRHVLEHLGETLEKYKTVWQELYRVCAPGAKVFISVPHPKNDDFIDDPTHVRAVTPRQFVLFDQEFNRECEEGGWADSQLGKYWRINFKMIYTQGMPTPLYLEKNPARREDQGWLQRQAYEKWNQVVQTDTVLEAVK